MIAKIVVAIVFPVLLLIVGLFRAHVLGVRLRDTGWPYFAAAAAMYLIGGILASMP